MPSASPRIAASAARAGRAAGARPRPPSAGRRPPRRGRRSADPAEPAPGRSRARSAAGNSGTDLADGRRRIAGRPSAARACSRVARGPRHPRRRDQTRTAARGRVRRSRAAGRCACTERVYRRPVGQIQHRVDPRLGGVRRRGSPPAASAACLTARARSRPCARWSCARRGRGSGAARARRRPAPGSAPRARAPRRSARPSCERISRSVTISAAGPNWPGERRQVQPRDAEVVLDRAERRTRPRRATSPRSDTRPSWPGSTAPVRRRAPARARAAPPARSARTRFRPCRDAEQRLRVRCGDEPLGGGERE